MRPPPGAPGPREVLIRLAVLALVAAPQLAHANAGVPMIAFYLPPAWFALVPIVLLEAAIGVRRWGLSPRSAIVAQAKANRLSTLVGLPLAWVLLVVLQSLIAMSVQGRGLSPRAQRIFEATFMSAWLPPDETNLRWMVPVAILVLTVLFWGMSVLVESQVLRRACRELSPGESRSWAVMANLVSYALLLVLLSTAWVWPALFEAMGKSLEPVVLAVVALVEIVMRSLFTLVGWR